MQALNAVNRLKTEVTAAGEAGSQAHVAEQMKKVLQDLNSELLRVRVTEGKNHEGKACPFIEATFKVSGGFLEFTDLTALTKSVRKTWPKATYFCLTPVGKGQLAVSFLVY